MIELQDLKEAFIKDIKTKPYFLRDLQDANNVFVYRLGYESLYELTPALVDKAISSKQIKIIYANVWNRLDILLEASTNYFQLYYQYLYELIEFYIDICEKSELYEVASNLLKIKQMLDDSK